MKKRIVSLLLAVLLVLPFMPVAQVHAAGNSRGDLYRLINQERTRAGLSALSASSYLNACSTVRIYELFQNFSHTRPDGRDWRTVLEDKNLPVDVAYSGEIICAGQTSAAEALSAFMNSPAHKEILMDDKFNFMGVGHGVQNGADYWVVNFTRSSQLQHEDDCFGSSGGEEPLPDPGNINLAMYYGDVTTKNGKVLLDKDNPFLRCWVHAPVGSLLQSWRLIVTDQQKNQLTSIEIPEEETFSSQRKTLSMAMWRVPENGILDFPTFQLEPGKDYYYKVEATVNGRTYSSTYIPFIVEIEGVEPVTLTLTEKPGSDGAVLVDSAAPALHATLKAPIGSKVAYSLSIYPLDSDTPMGRFEESRTGTISQNPATVGFTVWKTPVGNKITYSNISLTLGETYRYDLTVTVNGTVYTTAKGRFRFPAPETKTYTVTFFNPINGTSSTKTVTNGQPYGTLPTPPDVSGYTFEGWYANTNYTQRVTKDTVVNLTKDQTLYARMVRVQDKAIALTLTNKTGLSGTQTVSPYNGKFEATLSAPSGLKVTQHIFNVYTTGGVSLGSHKESCNETTNGTDYSVYRTITSTGGTVTDGMTLNWGGFKLTAGSTYLYEFSVIVDGKTYTTERARFRISASSGSSAGFSDVKPGAYYIDAVKWAVDKGITSGIGGGKFGPSNPCTREQIVTFLWNDAGKPAAGSAADFKDMPKNETYQKAISWAAEKSITSGYAGNVFRPGKTCTRAEAMTFIWRAHNCPEPSSIANLTDLPDIPDFRKAISWAYENGILAGDGKGHCLPGKNCTRAEIVSFLYRAKDL